MNGSSPGRGGQRPTPVLILGGMENALALCRSLGSRGVPVHVSTQQNCPVNVSRFRTATYPVPPGTLAQEHWQALLERLKGPLAGAVLFCASDDAIELVCQNAEALAQHFTLELMRPELRLAMLDKLATLRLGRQAGVPTPNFWAVERQEQIQPLLDEASFPLILKPLHSHVFQRHYRNHKFLTPRDPDELHRMALELWERGIAFMGMEQIPGPDTQLSSYYCYRTAAGDDLLGYTKRVLRRSPPNEGGGCYHLTQWMPETAAQGRTFFEAVDYLGLGNIEFKRDPRDDQLKLIEVNARFTAAQELLVQSNADSGHLCYQHLTGGPLPTIGPVKEGARLWYPVTDVFAYKALKARGELTAGQWLRSVLKPQSFPFFAARDPLPGVMRLGDIVRATLRRRRNAHGAG